MKFFKSIRACIYNGDEIASKKFLFRELIKRLKYRFEFAGSGGK